MDLAQNTPLERRPSFSRSMKGNYYNLEMSCMTACEGPSSASGQSRFSRNKHKRRSKTMPCSISSIFRSDSFGSVRQITKMFEFSMMSEGRKVVIQLLDDRRLEVTVQPKLMASELLDMVASHFSLKEKDYFGLCYLDETSHSHWLQLDRRVLEHDFPTTKRVGPLLLSFAVRFFIESICFLRDNATIELFYLQARHSIYKGQLEMESSVVFDLGALVLQAHCGDYSDDDTARKNMKKLPVLPTVVLREHPSITYCESRIIEQYKQLTNVSRGEAIISYMSTVESQPTYGIHYYEVKDKSGLPWWLGISYKGISLYDYTDKRTPRKVFAWKQLENLYFRDKKFSIEVHDFKRVVNTISSFNVYQDALQQDGIDDLADAINDPTTQVSVSGRAFGPGNVTVHAWFTTSQNLTKCIWSMAVCQHQFYLDRKQSRSQLEPARSLNEIATELGHSTASLLSSGGEEFPRSDSVGSLSLHSSKTELTPEALEAAQQARQQMADALRTKRNALQELLRKKTDELKALCVKEAEITGTVPPEWPDGHEKPKVIKTTYAISPDFIEKAKNKSEEWVRQLELDHEIQKQIVEAALRLAKDTTVAKNVKKKRKQAYTKAQAKLKELEKRINDYRRFAGQTPIHREIQSADELSEDSREFLDSDNEILSPVNSPSRHRVPLPRNHSTGQLRVGSDSQDEIDSAMTYPKTTRPTTPSSNSQGSGQYPPSPVVSNRYPYNHGINRGSTPSPTPHRRLMPPPTGHPRAPPRTHTAPSMAGYGAAHPAFPPTLLYHPPPTPTDPSNLYNLPSKQVGMYHSRDELQAESSANQLTRTGSFESSSSGSGQGYGYNSQRLPGYPPIFTTPDDNDDKMSLPELLPSKFGSKRESHSDWRDSPYHQQPAGDYAPPRPPPHHHRPTPQEPSQPQGPVTLTYRHRGTSTAPPSSNFVEYCKPFETADAVRYSEKRRTQQQHHHRNKPPIPPPIAPPHEGGGRVGQGGYVSQRAVPAPPQRPARSRSTSPLPNDAQYPTSHYLPATLSHSSSYGSSGYGSSGHLQYGHHGAGDAYMSPPSHSSSASSFQSLPRTAGNHHHSLLSIREDSPGTHSNPNQSFGSFNSSSVSRAFSQELLQWYDNQDCGPQLHSSTLV